MAQAPGGDHETERHIHKLVHCVEHGSLGELKSLVRGDFDLHTVDDTGHPLIHHAVVNPNTDVLELFLEAGVSIETRDNLGRTPLHVWARRGTVKSTQVLIAHGANIHARDYLGSTAMHYAAFQVNPDEMVSYLVAQGVNINDKDEMGQTAFHCCARLGRVRGMMSLVRNGANFEEPLVGGITPLHLAVMRQSSQAIKYLIELGVDIDPRDDTGLTPLHVCAWKGTTRNTALLVKAGADVGAMVKNGTTALHFAVTNQRTSGVVKYLLSQGIPAGSSDKYGNKPLHICARFGNLKNIKVLLEKSHDLEIKNGFGQTALHWVAMNQNTAQIIAFLLSKGASIDTRCDTGATPLLHSAAKGTLENLQVLVERGANMRAQDGEGKTAIHYALSNANSAVIVEFLLNRGLSIEAHDNFGRTPLLYYAQHGTLQSVEMLIDMGANINARTITWITTLHLAAVNEKTTEIMELLLGKGMYIDERDMWGLTPLHHSIHFANVTNMKFLVEKGADVNAVAQENASSLHLAVHGDTNETMEYLLEKGVPIDVTDNQGRTPLMVSVIQGNLQKINFLIENGANILMLDAQGVSSLHFASVNKESIDIMQILLDLGTPLEVKDNFGLTPLLYSAMRGSLKNVAFLCDRGADVKSLDNNKRTALHYAAQNIEGGLIIAYLLGKGIPVNVRDEFGASPSLIARVFGLVGNERILLKIEATSQPPWVHEILNS